MKNALLLDTAREIKRSVSRFLSIFTIIALGCGFFSGIKATMPDMIDTAAAYFEDNRLMDYKLVSNIGIRSEDVQAVRNAPGVKGAVAGYSKDVFYHYNNQNCVLKVMSINTKLDRDSENYLNKPVLLEGRMPEKSGECVVEIKLSSPKTFKIGNTLTLSEPDPEGDILDTLATDTFEIVGIVTSPLYIGYQRDPTTVGNGTVLSYIMISEDDFTSDYYSELYIAFDGLEDQQPFSDEYTDLVNEKKIPAVEAFTDSVRARYDKLAADSQKQLDSADEQTDTLKNILESDTQTLDHMAQQGRAELGSAQKSYDGMQNKNSAQALLLRSKIIRSQNDLAILDELISARREGSTAADEKYSAMLAEAQTAAENARAQLDAMPELTVYEYDRFSSTDYSSFENDSQKIDSIAKVFPAFFILIAALVCLTTMTRMVEEQRIQIGTYKALGYSSGQIAFKYLAYGTLAAVSGSCIGTAAGLQIFPYIIYNSYKIMYNIPSIDTPFRPMYLILCMLVSVICTDCAVMYSCIKELRSQPSQLMRPKPPVSGKRVLLENISLIWKRLDFLAKVTVRNLLRYKKRFFMTIVGVAGCTALIIAGFGLKKSISAVAEKQFSEIFLYDATVVMNTADKDSPPEDAAQKYDEIENGIFVTTFEADCKNNGVTQTVNIVVPETVDNVGEYVALIDKDSTEIIEPRDDGVIITEKLAAMLGLQKGGDITLTSKDRPDVTAKINDIVKNYAMHYVYMTPQLYTRLYGEDTSPNMAYINVSDSADRNALKEKLVADPDYLGVSFKDDVSANFIDSLDSLDAIVLLLIVCAGFLAVIVLYNLANINITERVREIATIKVLGFYDSETSAYIYRENIVSALIGILAGLVLGRILHYFVVITAEVDIVMFDRGLGWLSYLFGALLTAVFALVVNIALHFKLKRIDMVESLKSVE